MIYDQQYNSHDLHVVTATKAYILRAFCNVGKIFKYICIIINVFSIPQSGVFRKVHHMWPKHDTGLSACTFSFYNAEQSPQ